jgi:hypothetical protein
MVMALTYSSFFEEPEAFAQQMEAEANATRSVNRDCHSEQTEPK